MKKILAVTLCILVPMAVFASTDTGYKVAYDGGSVQDVKAGTDLKLYIDATEIRLMNGKTLAQTIPVASITEVSYGQDVHRRVGAAIGVAMVSFGIGLLLLAVKSKKHFVGLTWNDGGKKGGFDIQCDKNEYRGVLAGLEGVSGKKAVDSDTMNVKN